MFKLFSVSDALEYSSISTYKFTIFSYKLKTDKSFQYFDKNSEIMELLPLLLVFHGVSDDVGMHICF